MRLVSFQSAAIAVCLSVFLFRIPARFRPLALLAGSLLFYMDTPELLALHFAHTVLTLGLAFLMYRFENIKKPLLAAGILAYFPAFLFLRGSGGFSYAMLIHIGFLLDAESSTSTYGIAESAAALTYFPCLQEGPIIDAFGFGEKLVQPALPSWDRCSCAVLRIVTGLMKKLIVADHLTVYVDAVFASPQIYSAFSLWIGMLLYAIQIYMDFSGCMDIVSGVSMLIGYDLPENFRRPYLADGFSEYWKRWHITMGAWFKYRVFYPLAASVPMLKLSGWLTSLFHNPFGRSAAVAGPLLLTWTLVGLWHGFAFHYILWGLANGMLILFESAIPTQKTYWPKTLRVLRTFLVLCFVRVLFRVENTGIAWQYYTGLFHSGGRSPLFANPDSGLAAALFFALLFFLIETVTEYRQPRNLSISGKLVLITLGTAAILIFGKYGPGYSPTEFYYNRF